MAHHHHNPWTEVESQLTRGYGVASGQSDHTPYPEGTIKLQIPHFLKLGLDLRAYYPGTLNLSIAPYQLHLRAPQWTLPQVKWFPGCCETFSFSDCQLLINDFVVDGLIYYPHPETKPDHFQDASIVEVLAPYIDQVNQQSAIRLRVKTCEVIILNP